MKFTNLEVKNTPGAVTERKGMVKLTNLPILEVNMTVGQSLNVKTWSFLELY